MEGQGCGVAEQSQQHDLQSVLSCSGRDFLIRNNGDQVKIDKLKGKKVGLYFAASWSAPCQLFTQNLVDIYNELSPKGDFEIIFVSPADQDEEEEEAFKVYFSKMPWLAIPFPDSKTRQQLNRLFKATAAGVPCLVILDENGKVLTEDGVALTQTYGADAFPLTQEKIEGAKEAAEELKKITPLKFLLSSGPRSWVISPELDTGSPKMDTGSPSADRQMIETTVISWIEDYTIGLYFADSTNKRCVEFTQKLTDFREKLKVEVESKFDIVMIPLDPDEESFEQAFQNIPWYSIPYGDKICPKLARSFGISTVPALAIVAPDGRILQSDAVKAIEKFGIEAYPFTPEKLSELEEKEKAAHVVS